MSICGHTSSIIYLSRQMCPYGSYKYGVSPLLFFLIKCHANHSYFAINHSIVVFLAGQFYHYTHQTTLSLSNSAFMHWINIGFIISALENLKNKLRLIQSSAPKFIPNNPISTFMLCAKSKLSFDYILLFMSRNWMNKKQEFVTPTNLQINHSY